MKQEHLVQAQLIQCSVSLTILLLLPLFTAEGAYSAEKKSSDNGTEAQARNTGNSKAGTTKAGTASDTKAKLDKKTSYANSVLGDWISEWGPVSFKKEKDGSYSGEWIEGGKKGSIEKGKFDEKTGAFEYDLCETWTDLHGHAKLNLSKDHSELSGSWVRQKTKGAKTMDEKGTWSMKRPEKVEKK